MIYDACDLGTWCDGNGWEKVCLNVLILEWVNKYHYVAVVTKKMSHRGGVAFRTI
jgi:hypothetical protein